MLQNDEKPQKSSKKPKLLSACVQDPHELEIGSPGEPGFLLWCQIMVYMIFTFDIWTKDVIIV